MKLKLLAAGLLLALSSSIVSAQFVRPLADFTKADAKESIKGTSAQVEFQQDTVKSSLTVTINPGNEGYPGIELNAGEKPFDLSPFSHVQAQITNLGEKPITITTRVDNKWTPQNPWNAENLALKPGETKAAKVYFGYSYGKKAYALDPAAVTKIMFFTGKRTDVAKFRIDSIEAGGVPGEAPPVDPGSIRIKPENGVILGPGGKSDLARQIAAKGGIAAMEGDALNVTLPGKTKDESVTLKPANGRWDLKDSIEVKVTIKNTGTTAFKPKVRIESNKGPTDLITGEELAAGAEATLTIPYASKTIWNGEDYKNTGSKFSSVDVSGVFFSADGSGERKFSVTSAKAGLAEQILPEWLGKRPPTEGDWKISFEDNFDGSTINRDKWVIYTANYWDKRTYFTKDNVIVENGLAKLRYEKKRGFHNDDPKGKELEYACGFLDTYGKWAQTYGYFEARMKLPTAPGLWPAFWMMPDRGIDAGEQWKRADTKNGGMEFDIMEHLTRWGPNRFNQAFHWDGYQKEHKAIGTDCAYLQPDKDGFITVGLLWEPGKAVIYGNGKVMATWENARISNVQSYVILYMVSGGWDNSPLDDAKLPADFEIDYVRCWQRSDLGAPGTVPMLKK